MADDVLLNKAASLERCVMRARDVFALLAQNGVIDAGLSETMQAMVGFRNIAVHDYQKMLLPIIASLRVNLATVVPNSTVPRRKSDTGRWRVSKG